MLAPARRHAAKRRTVESRRGAASMSPARNKRSTKLLGADVCRDLVGSRVLRWRDLADRQWGIRRGSTGGRSPWPVRSGAAARSSIRARERASPSRGGGRPVRTTSGRPRQARVRFRIARAPGGARVRAIVSPTHSVLPSRPSRTPFSRSNADTCASDVEDESSVLPSSAPRPRRIGGEVGGDVLGRLDDRQVADVGIPAFGRRPDM
jgi:hypothetical protein